MHAETTAPEPTLECWLVVGWHPNGFSDIATGFGHDGKPPWSKEPSKILSGPHSWPECAELVLRLTREWYQYRHMGRSESNLSPTNARRLAHLRRIGKEEVPQ